MLPLGRVVFARGRPVEVYLDGLRVQGVQSVKVETEIGVNAPKILRLTVCVSDVVIEETRS